MLLAEQDATSFAVGYRRIIKDAYLRNIDGADGTDGIFSKLFSSALLMRSIVLPMQKSRICRILEAESSE